MKIKELIKALQKADPENRVYLWLKEDDGEYLPYDFSGVGYDDLGDVELYVASGDEAV
jgi:hypothetical protein